MPESFILALILAGIAFLILAAAPLIARYRPMTERTVAGKYGMPNKVQEQGERVGYKTPIALATFLLVLAAVFTANASFNKVPLNNVGIVTQANKPVGKELPNGTTDWETTGPGYHWIEPWQKIEEWDANYERWDHLSEQNPAQVLIAGLQPAKLEIAVDYAPHESQAPQQFKDYKKEIERWRTNRALPTITTAVNSAFKDFDPLAGIDPNTGQVKTPDLAPYQEKVKQAILAAAPGEIKVKAVQIGYIHYSAETTKQINARAALLLQSGNLKIEKANQALKNQITNEKAQADPLTRCIDQAGQYAGLCGLLKNNGGNASVLVGTGK